MSEHHHTNKAHPPAPFGTLLGTSDNGVEVFSCNYEQMDQSLWSDMSWFVSSIEGNYTGFKYQCVELSRRYLLLNFGVIFDSIPMAYDIFRLESVRRVKDNVHFPFTSHANGQSTVLPVKGSLLIWKAVGEFTRTGHVAVIVNVEKTYVDIVEQNVEDSVWPIGVNYSRRLHAELDAEGRYKIFCTYGDAEILGWKTVELDKVLDYSHYPNCPADKLIRKSVQVNGQALDGVKWMDDSRDYVQLFFKKYGSRLVGVNDTEANYYELRESGEKALVFATNYLHQSFLDATDHVFQHIADIGDKFCIPERLWPVLRRSWFRERSNIISGRFDFALTSEGIKVYEYNADSASCLIECGLVQDSWIKAMGLEASGSSTSADLFQKLVDTWKARKVEGHLHLLCDSSDSEELFHTHYMKSAAEAAGLECTVLGGFSSIRWTETGDLQDSNGILLKNIWKTWSWRTALNQMTDEEIEIYLPPGQRFTATIQVDKSKFRLHLKPKLVDVLFHPDVRVFEPLWTLIPSCKAILPVLWNLKRNHPYYLDSSFDLKDSGFEASGYAAKPVTGRAGGNIALYDEEGKLIEETPGKWGDDKCVYQKLCMLPKYGDEYVQVCTWVIDGSHAGTVLRVDKSGIINYESNCYPLRVIPDEC